TIPISSLPPILETSALFLDFDGTLADIAPHPDAVHLAPGLIAALEAIEERLGGALAIVSGRPVDALDRFLDPWRPTLAAEHGGLLRLPDGTLSAPPPPDLHPAETAATALAAEHPGLYVERKRAAVALHYRSAPELESLCRHTMSSVV